MGYLHIIMPIFLSDGNKWTHDNKIDPFPYLFLIINKDPFPYLFLMIVMKKMNSYFSYVKQFIENAFIFGILLLNREEQNLKLSIGEEVVLPNEPGLDHLPL